MRQNSSARQNLSSQLMRRDRRIVTVIESLESRQLFNTVSLVASDPTASLVAGDTAAFTVSLDAPNPADTTVTLQIGTSVSQTTTSPNFVPPSTAPFNGTAVGGTDFTSAPASSVTILGSTRQLVTPVGRSPTYTYTFTYAETIKVVIPTGQLFATATFAEVYDPAATAKLVLNANLVAQIGYAISPTNNLASVSFDQDKSVVGSVSGTAYGAPVGTTIFLDANGNRVLDAGELLTTAAADGSYAFPVASPGSYVAEQILPQGFGQTSPTNNAGIAVNVTAGLSVTANFTDVPTTGSINGVVSNAPAGMIVFADYNGNGQLDAGEPSATTINDGTYSILYATPGTYAIRQSLPAVYAQLSPAAGAGVMVTIVAGQASTGINFNDDLIAPLSGTITGGPATEMLYADSNDNDIYDHPGWDGNYETAINSAAGAYLFTTFDYVQDTVIRQLLPAGYVQVSPSNNDGYDIFTDPGVAITNLNFVDKYVGTASTGSISGIVTGGAPNESVFLDSNGNGILDSGEPQTQTDNDGSYSFVGLPTGTYTVAQSLPQDGYAQMVPANNVGIVVNVTTNATVGNVNFTDITTPTFGEVGGTASGIGGGVTIYLDANNDGLLDNSELSTYTQDSGDFEFQNVPSGNYTVREDLPPGFIQTSPADNAGVPLTVTDRSTLSAYFINASATNVPDDGTIAGQDVGGAVSETNYLDINDNGTLDAAEPTAVTGINGFYAFNNVPAGTYVVRQMLPSGYAQTSPTSNSGIVTAVSTSSTLLNQTFTDSAIPTSGSVGGTITGGLAGEIVYLDANKNSTLDSGELSTTTSSSGTYVFPIVPVGSYAIRQVVPGGYTQTSPSSNAGIAVAVAAGGTLVSQNFTDSIVTTMPVKLAGTTIGTAGSYQSKGNTIAKATDGNLSTFFDGPTPNGNWVGIDLGAAGGIVTQVKFASRSGLSSRMNGGIFQASNSSTFANGVVNLYTIASNANPSSISLTTQTIANKLAYRYYRYLSPNGSYGNVSEAQFFGTAGAIKTYTKLTGTAIGTAGSYASSGNTISKAADGNLLTYFDGPTANGDWVGLDLGSSKAISQIAFAPRGGLGSRMVGGLIQISTTANFGSGVTTIYTITTAPMSGVLTTVTLASPVTARYVRYLSPNGGYGNIAEFQVLG